MADKSGWFSHIFEGSSEAGDSGSGLRSIFSHSAVPKPMIWQEGQIVLEDFEIQKVLGEGAQGLVYLVLSQSVGRRYAVKRIKFSDPESQRNIMAELQGWLYLPEHPYLTACRFARTVNDEIDVFIESMSGQTLKDSITKGALYEGGPPKALERILDLSIQMAWGVHAIHEMKLIHEDVRPRNVFVSTAGIARITDIGFCRAMAYGVAATGQLNGISSDPSVTAYYAPEMRDGGQLVYASDIWSWAVSVLEMFVGGITWPDKTALPFLEAYLKTGPEKPIQPPMPEEVAAVLRKCLIDAPRQRMENIGDAADALRQIYQNIIGKPYPRPAPAALHRGTLLSIAHARWFPGGGVQWSDPYEWKTKAMRLAGQRNIAYKKMDPHNVSRKIQAKNDLPGYVNAQIEFEKLLASGRKDVKYDFAIFCCEKGCVHVAMLDFPGALSCFEKGTKLLEDVVNVQNREDLANDLGMAYLNCAIATKEMGDFKKAITIYEQASKIWDRLVNKEGRKELTGNLAWVMALRANVEFHLSDQIRSHGEILLKQANESKASPPQLADSQQTPDQILAKSLENTRVLKELFLKAETELTASKTIQKKAQEDARSAVRLLKTEVSRTEREDLKAISHWAQNAFDGYL